MIMRRKEREVSEDAAFEVADRCLWASAAMTDTNGNPYCVPLNIVREGNFIYFHAAQEGRKTDILKKNPRIYISCVCGVKIDANRFTTEYESAAICGKAEEVENTKEKIHALKILCERYASENMKGFENAVSKYINKTAVWKITVESITGKRNK